MRSSDAWWPSRIGRSNSANLLSPALPRYALVTCVSTRRCSASFITLRIGVLPAPSRKTPTPTSIFSGRGSASHKAISASSESFTTGGRSARPFGLACVCVSMGPRLAESRVVIHRHPVAEGDRLAREHITVRDLFVGQPVARRHLDLALGHFRPA